MMKKIAKQEKITFLIIALFGIIISIMLAVQAISEPEGASNKWFLSFQVLLGVLLCLLPFLLERLFKFKASLFLKIFYWIFILFAVFLGTGLSYYSKFYYWDKLLHFSSAMLLAVLGIGILSVFEPDFKHVSIPTIVLFGFFFAMTAGVFWEFYEFTFDGLLGLNMQRFATSSGKNLIGRAVLIDTMGDLFTNTFGALVFSLLAFIKAKKNQNWLRNLAFTTHKNKTH